MLLIDKIETELIKILEGKNKEVVLHVHTFIASHLTKGLNSIQINLSDWSEGNYILSISDGKQMLLNEQFQILK